MKQITVGMIRVKLAELTKLLRERGVEGELRFYLGNARYRQTNHLMLGGTNLWPDAMGGYTKRDAYNALRLMVTALSVEDWSAHTTPTEDDLDFARDTLGPDATEDDVRDLAQTRADRDAPEHLRNRQENT